MPRQPFFRVGAMAGEIDQLGVLAWAVEHLDRTDLRSFGHDEGQVAVDREGAVDTKHHDTAAAIVAGMQRNARADDSVADTAFRLLADQAAAAVTVFPSRELLAMPLWRPRRVVGKSDDRAERSEVFFRGGVQPALVWGGG